MLLIAAFIPNIVYLHGFLGLRTLTMLAFIWPALWSNDHSMAAQELDSQVSETPFILELPQYRMPTLRSLGLRLVDRARVFLRQAGTSSSASRWRSGCWLTCR